MRLLAGLTCASTVLQAYGVSAQALIYTSESLHQQSRAEPSPLSPHAASLLLAQRLGVSQYHSLGDTDENTLAILNKFGGYQQPIFRDDERAGREDKLLLIVEGVTSPGDIFNTSTKPALSIYPQPSGLSNRELATDLLEQNAHARSAEAQSYFGRFTQRSSIQGGLSYSGMSSKKSGQLNDFFSNKDPKLAAFVDLYKSMDTALHSITTILHVSSIQGLTSKDGSRYTTALSDIKTFITHFHNSTSPISSTIILMPHTSTPNKRSTTSPYGPYTNPLRPRQQQEEPLSSPSHTPSHSSAPEIFPAETSSTPSTALPKGILPLCHSTLESTISTTNNCSGHGTPYLKSSGETDCWACRCAPTVLTDEEGRVKTIKWGGPACQKKDISVPFFLLAGLTIGLVAAVTWGVGLLVSIGSEELPSVIGAGVTGPRAQK